MKSFFEDMLISFEGDNSTTTVTSIGGGAATGAMVGGPIGAAVGAGLGLMSAGMMARQKRKAEKRARAAQTQAREEARQNRNALVEQNFRRRSTGRAGLGGPGNLSPGQEGASRQGTSLLAAGGQTQQTSLFEGIK